MWLAVAFSIGGPAHAQSVHDQVRPSLVFLKATGLSASGPAAGTKPESKATGFLISESGLVLTAYHLVGQLEDKAIEPTTLRIRANLSSPTENPEISVSIVHAIPTLDLLLLKLPSRVPKYPFLELGKASKDVAIYTSGFPSGANPSDHSKYVFKSGQVTSTDAPGGYLWETNITFASGQSGSPVYNKDAKVVGIAKGQATNTPTSNYFIPIRFADSLLVNLRLQEIRRDLEAIAEKLKQPGSDPGVLNSRMTDLETHIDKLRRQFTWRAEFQKKSGTRILRVSYEKLLEGKPHPRTANLVMKAVATRNGKVVGNLTLPYDRLKQDGSQAASGGFEVETEKNMKHVEGLFPDANVTYTITIKPRFPSGEGLLHVPKFTLKHMD